jgi:acyl-CoA thioesterase YciA
MAKSSGIVCQVSDGICSRRQTEEIKVMDRANPTLRTVPFPQDINANGHIFGGWVLSQMDIAGGLVAHRVAGGSVATVAIESMQFIAPILMMDTISIYATVERRGQTSLGIRIVVLATRGTKQEEIEVTNGLFTFVALDDNHRPRSLPAVG